MQCISMAGMLFMGGGAGEGGVGAHVIQSLYKWKNHFYEMKGEVARGSR